MECVSQSHNDSDRDNSSFFLGHHYITSSHTPEGGQLTRRISSTPECMDFLTDCCETETNLIVVFGGKCQRASVRQGHDDVSRSSFFVLSLADLSVSQTTIVLLHHGDRCFGHSTSPGDILPCLCDTKGLCLPNSVRPRYSDDCFHLGDRIFSRLAMNRPHCRLTPSLFTT